MNDTCTLCGSNDNVNKHHYFPKRWYKKDRDKMKKTVRLCQQHHAQAEVMLHIAEHDQRGHKHQIRDWQYLALHQTFMKEGYWAGTKYAELIRKSSDHERQRMLA